MMYLNFLFKFFSEFLPADHGLFCHNCKSQSDSEPDCKEIVDDRFLKLCKVGERCGEIYYLMGTYNYSYSCYLNFMLNEITQNTKMFNIFYCFGDFF